MKTRLCSPASRELADGVRWHESQSPGRGRDFALANKLTVARIEQYPKAGAADSRGLRTARVSHVPYTIWYRIESEAIYIYAIAHSHRDPNYWIDRL